MAILPWPAGLRAPDDRSIRFGLPTNTAFFGGTGLALSERTEDLGGAKWALQAAWTDLTDDEAPLLQAFLAALGGPAGRTLQGDMGYLIRGPRGAASGAPTILSFGQVGSALLTDGWTPSTLVLREGDYVAWWVGPALQDDSDREMHMVTADATSDVSGQATVNIAPPLRLSPEGGAAIDVAAATCKMRLLDDEQIFWGERSLYAPAGGAKRNAYDVQLSLLQTWV